jgi:DNA-binding transcriptional regulator GbsR (MarR family)
MELKPIAERFVLHWGEMGSRWGVNRTVAQIHALLYLAARPMDAEEITDTLGVARSNVSNSLKELQSWNLVRIVHLKGDRRDHFETSTDVWETQPSSPYANAWTTPPSKTKTPAHKNASKKHSNSSTS